ncbi:DEAD/DEAH box helicase [Actinomycetaceae bacterium TAE3-ERU4]|nr:DEAD/DEAH box helicase [Actinomycetaceae bacterium TAE3-ERU4]
MANLGDDAFASKLFSSLVTEGERADRFLGVLELPGRIEKFSKWPDWVNPLLLNSLTALGIERPWSHQAQAADFLHSGSHTVLATGTGSGKSLSAWLPILSDLCDVSDSFSTRISQVKHSPTALYLSPTKALAADQHCALERLVSAEKKRLPVNVGVADGDTSSDLKRWARAHADVVITNPDYVHHALCPNHALWARFLRSLRYVIIDEVHSYRGLAGAHFSLVLRRLLRLANFYGADPTVIALSATLGNPRELLGQFLGISAEKIVPVVEDGSPAAPKKLVLWQPALLDSSGADEDGTEISSENDEESGLLSSPRRSAATEGAYLSAQLMALGARLLTFTRSRYGAEQVKEISRKILQVICPERSELIAAYRGGYLPEERRELESGLREGSIQALVTTSALELGIDISGLDATVTVGWPGTRASLWQQVGRSGRGGSAGISFFIASANPLDNFLVTHPQELSAPSEQAVFDTSNPFVLGPHICAAAAELPIRDSDLEIFGLTDFQVLYSLAETGLVSKRPAGWFWNATLPYSAHDLADLRGMGQQVQVVNLLNGDVIGSVDEPSSQMLLHPGAIYVHQSRTFEVKELGSREALVVPYEGKLRTRPSSQTEVEILAVDESFSSPDGLISFSFGTVNVISQVTDYDVLLLPGLRFVDNHNLSLPPRVLETRAVWWTVDPRVVDQLGLDASSLPGSLHAAEHASIGILPLLATCDRWDLGGLSTPLHPQTGLPTVFVHDAVTGGSGFARHGYDNLGPWLSLTERLVCECVCDEGSDELGSLGCPRCVQSPKCGNGNEPLDRAGAARLLGRLLDFLPREK